MNSDQYQQPSFSPNEQITPKEPIHWYSTTGGKVFIVISTILITVLLLFGSLVGYYLVQLETGNEATIVSNLKKSQEKFSALSGKKRTSTDLSATQILSTINANTPNYGSASAPNTIIMFIDLECPFCQESYSVFKDISKQRPQSIKVYFKHFPLSSIHPNAVVAANALECAKEQQKFWEYYDLLFVNKRLNKESLYEYAQKIGLDEPVFDACFTSYKYVNIVEKDFADGVNLGVLGTPTYIVNNKIVQGVLTPEEWQTLLK